MRFAPRSVRARLTLWYTVVLAVPLAVFALASYLVFSRAVHARTDAFLSDALSVFAREVVAERRAIPDLVTAIAVTLAEVRFQDLDIVVAEEDGDLLATSAHPEGAAPIFDRTTDSAALHDALLEAAGSGGGVARTLRLASGSARVLLRPHVMGERRLVLAGIYPLREIERMLATIRRMFLIAIPLLIASAAAGGWFLARRSFAPVTAMASRAAEIGATTLHERLPVASDDELGTLARVLNDLLDRLERSFEQQRRFMADASHELRTPAAVLRAEADVTLSRPSRSESEYRESMAVVQDAARRLTRIVDDIFLLARADAGHVVMHPTALQLDDVVIDSVRAVQAIARARGIRVEVTDLVDVRVTGDADLLGRIFLNLLDNAVKHSPDGAVVEVRMERRGDEVATSVIDHGPGIPAAAQSRVFERFYRADAARSRTENTITSGAGLGLPIARAIAELHGGHVELAASRPGMTEFVFVMRAAEGRLPGARVATPAGERA